MTDGAERIALVVVGHVDHGKSTILGRLLHDSGQLPTGTAEAIIAAAERRGMPVEWSFVLDALQVERDQAITLDTTLVSLTVAGRRLDLIDAPGHPEFLGRMVAGATRADAGVIVIDAQALNQAQLVTHARVFQLLGIQSVVVALNKLDMVAAPQQVVEALAGDIATTLAAVGLTLRALVPTIARTGAMLVDRGAGLDWYTGPTLLEALAALPAPPAPVDQPLRLAVQDVQHLDHRRIIVGRVLSGQVAVGDRLRFLPGSALTRVASVEGWPSPPSGPVRAGAAIGITLDNPVFVTRGALACGEDRPAHLTSRVQAQVLWLDLDPLRSGARLTLASQWARVSALVEAVTAAGGAPESAGDALGSGQFGRVTLHTRDPLALDAASDLPATGRVLLLREGRVVGVGAVLDEGLGQHPVRPVVGTDLRTMTSSVTPHARAERNRHRGAVVWLTGLSGAGKSTLAMVVEQHLFQRGAQVAVLDGDAVRGGLNADLGFSPEDRTENIRRIGEVAALMADAGLIVLTALISPYREDRARARAAAARTGFYEVFVATPLAACEARDPKGLYAKARAGTLPAFTGISAPYEAPLQPDLVINTADASLDTCATRLLTAILGWVGDPG
ncbi:MAG: adenylyl-sulfate kinase [Alphaproteobacteria bacterium]|nr:adenylyl-sulfate kinase [Alphaproteobacteria bacterium]